MIPQPFIEEVQNRTDIAELISGYIPLKKAGRNFKALCPFHGEKTASFVVSPQKQIFHCFGCGEGGGSLQFLMLYDKVNFAEAVEILAKRLGMDIPYEKSSPQKKLKMLLYEAAQQAATFFYNNLISSNRAEFALNYLRQRGLSREIVDKFRIGFALGRNTLLEHMRKGSFTLDILEKASLVVSRQQGGYIDLFRERIIFPIFDVRTRVVGFGARVVNERDNIPKYINSFENILYSKRDHLFGLNFSKDDIIKKDSVIITEGYLDMITSYQAGIKNIVASLGTALTLEQIRLIKRYTKNVILVFDSDKAGQNASLRALDLLLESGLNIKMLTMPAGFDLDLAIRKKGLPFVSGLLDKKEDFFDYKVNMLKNTYDIQSIEGKVNIAAALLGTINKLNSEIQKYEYIKKLSAELRVKEEILIAELRKIDNGTQKSYLPRVAIKDVIPMAEKLVLKFILTNPKVIDAVKRNIQIEDFSHPLTRETFSLVVQDLSKTANCSLSGFLGSIENKKISGLVSQVLMEDVGELNKNILKDCIVKMRNNRTRILKEGLRTQMREAERNKDAKKLKELMLEFRKINSEVRNG